MSESWLPEAKKKLKALRALEANWDSYGAYPIDRSSISRARALLVYLANRGVPKPHVGANPLGLVALEWTKPEIEITVCCTDDSGYVVIADDTEYVSTDKAHIAELLGGDDE